MVIEHVSPRRAKIQESLESLKENDLYSFILFALYHLKGDARYATMSEMVYLTDIDSFLALCKLFGGMTVTFPTVEEMTWMMTALRIYYEADILGIKSYDEAMQEFKTHDNAASRCITDMYNAVKGVMQNYDFHARDTK